jgi:hypothetical protein
MKLEHSGMQSDSSRFARRVDRDNTMVTEGHRYVGKKRKEEKLAEFDKEMTKELYELKADIEKFELWMQQDRRRRQMRELPMEKAKAKWLVKKPMVIR